jgi:hypothetical protein
MGCHRITTPCGKIKGWLCLKNIYRYKGFLFEWHSYLGPCALREDFKPRQRVKKGFWDICAEFSQLSDDGKKDYLIYG